MSLLEIYDDDQSCVEYDYDMCDDPLEDYGYEMCDDPLEDYGYEMCDDPLEDYGWDQFDIPYWELEFDKPKPEVPIFTAQGTHTNHHGFRVFTLIMKAFKLDIINVKWVYFKWVFIVLNFVIEVCQATFTQENALGKISTPFYLKLSVVTSSFCMMISLVEAIQEGKESKVVWQKRGYVGWFYYPGSERQRRLFARFALVFGVVSSTIQLCINLVALVIYKSFLQFDVLPLLLSSGYLVAALVDRGGKDMVIKCDVHGRCVAECSRCKVDASV